MAECWPPRPRPEGATRPAPPGGRWPAPAADRLRPLTGPTLTGRQDGAATRRRAPCLF